MNVQAPATAAESRAATPAPDIATIGVIGAGQMGSGIAHVCALAGMPVVIGYTIFVYRLFRGKAKADDHY